MADSMNWFDWTVFTWFAVNAVGAVALVGKHRDPVTPGVAAIMVVMYALLIWGVLAT